MTHHIAPLKLYFGVFGALMALTATTVWVATVDLGPLNIFVALGIAFVKAVLVVLYFMHVKYSERLVQVVVGSALGWLVVMLVLTLSDYFSRSWQTLPVGWQ